MKKINFNFKKNKEFNSGDLGYIRICLVGIRYLLTTLKKKVDGRILDNSKVLKVLDDEIGDYTVLIENVKSLSSNSNEIL